MAPKGLRRRRFSPQKLTPNQHIAASDSWLAALPFILEKAVRQVATQFRAFVQNLNTALDALDL